MNNTPNTRVPNQQEEYKFENFTPISHRFENWKDGES